MDRETDKEEDRERARFSHFCYNMEIERAGNEGGIGGGRRKSDASERTEIIETKYV